MSFPNLLSNDDRAQLYSEPTDPSAVLMDLAQWAGKTCGIPWAESVYPTPQAFIQHVIEVQRLFLKAYQAQAETWAQ